MISPRADGSESRPYLANGSTGQLASKAYFAAFGFALERFTLRTDSRVARGLTGALAR